LQDEEITPRSHLFEVKKLESYKWELDLCGCIAGLLPNGV